MKLTIFQSDKGDCLLLTSGGSKPVRMLIDGGMKASFQKHVAPALSKLPKLDLVYLSHIDDDHIAGVLQLMDDTVAWRVYGYQKSIGNGHFRKPTVPKPPRIEALWHNSFAEQIPTNTGEIEDMLAASAESMLAVNGASACEAYHSSVGIISSVNQAVQLRRRASAEQLGIPVNQPAGGRLMMVETAQNVIKLGPLKIWVIGPLRAELKRLRDQWNDWLDKNKKRLDAIRAKANEDRRNMGLSEFDRLLQPMLEQAKQLGDRSKVTVPNLASLTLFVEENGKRVLLTGDGHADDILKGLDKRGLLRSDGSIHVDVLKVQHHGSEHNIEGDFCKRVTADHYVFCGNGFSGNPELPVIEAILDSRRGSASRRSKNPESPNPFELWFNFSSQNADHKKYAAHLRKVERLVADREGAAGAKFRSRYLKDRSSILLQP